MLQTTGEGNNTILHFYEKVDTFCILFYTRIISIYYHCGYDDNMENALLPFHTFCHQ